MLVTGGYNPDMPDQYPAGAELYDPQTNTWSYAAEVLTPAMGRSATLLADGRLLLAGGFNGSGSVSTAELYEVAAGFWQAGGELTTGRAGHTGTLLPDGRLLVAGGIDDAFNILASAEVYDPALNAWSAVAPLSEARIHHSATLLPDGKVLVAGGQSSGGVTLASAEMYDPASDSWSAAASMNVARRGQIAVLLADGRVLAAGGQDAGAQPLDSAEIYDPVADTWTPVDALNVGRYNHSAILMADGNVLLTGGWNAGYLDSAEIYDPAANAWTLTGPMSQERWRVILTLLPDGRVLATGGTGGGGELQLAEFYDPGAGGWGMAAPMNTGRIGHSATLLPGGQVLVVGGENSGTYLKGAELYDPATDLWVYTGSLDVGRRGHTATLLPDGQVLIVSGSGPLSLTSAEIFDPGLGYSPDWQPALDAFGAPLVLAAALSASGAQFTGHGLAEASGGASSNSATNSPLAQLYRLDNGHTQWLPLERFTAGSFDSAAPAIPQMGHALLTVFVNGIPSRSQIVNFNRRPSGVDEVLKMLEDASLTFAAADFPFGDPDGDAQGPVEITTLESAGDLECAGVDVTTATLCAPADLTFRPAPDASGAPYAAFTFKVQDEHGAASEMAYAMTLNVAPVNDAPGFTPGPDQTVLVDSDAYSIPGWATDISAGPGEAGQTLTFTLSASDPSLFSVAPAVDISGTLSFTPAPGITGTTTVSITLQDSGGVADGGQDTSAVQSFRIAIGVVLPGGKAIYLPLVTK